MNKSQTMFDWYVWQAVKYMSYFGWGTGSIFSYIGVTSIANLPWWMKVIAAIFAVGINVIEAAWGRMTTDELLHPKDADAIILNLFGIVAYVYDIWTNVLGFTVMFTGTASVMLAWNVDKTLLVWPLLFGIMFAIGPEPLYRFYLRNTFPKPQSYKVKSSYTAPTQKWTPTTPAKPGPSSELIERLRKNYPEHFNK